MDCAKRPLEAVIFDFGGVISQPLGPLLGSVEREFGIPPGEMQRALYSAPLWPLAEVGEMSYAEYVSGCKVALRSFLSAECVEDAWARWYAAFYRPSFMPGVIELIGELRGRVRLALLSNASDGAEGRWQSDFGISGHFDVIVNSASIGIAKPDARAFRITMKKLGLPPGACFFVDDTRANVDAAAALGIRSHLFEDAATLRAALLAEGLRL